MDAKIAEQVKELIDNARKNLEKDGELLPVFFVVAEDTVNVVVAPFGNNDEKHAAAQGVRMLSDKLKAEWVLYISEAWTVKYDKDDPNYKDADKVAPSQHPKKVEAVIASLQIRGDKTYFGMVETMLYSDGHKSFGEINLESHEDDGTGTFSDLLNERAGKGQAPASVKDLLMEILKKYKP